MKTFSVGGSVRDQLLGLKPHDYDYVVVGATPAEMEAMNYKQVGKDFPVYLHPDTGEEYALARTERKSGLKHTDFETVFDTSITIEEDLARRDLTINSIAKDLVTGEFIDPFDGMQDIKSKILRHTTEAFKEDPLRVLRLARFSAKFPNFTIAPETVEMVRNMVANGELDHLSPNRIWEETKKALLSSHPLKYFDALRQFRAINYLLIPEDKWQSPAHEEFDLAMSVIVELTTELDDVNKLILRAAVMFNMFAYLYNDPKEFLKTLTAKKIPSEIVDFIEFIEYNNDTLFTVNVKFANIEKLVKTFDKMRLKSRIQKNEKFLDNVAKYCTAVSASDSTPHKFSEIRIFMELYLDVQDHVSSWAKMYMLNNGIEPTGKEYAEQTHIIRHNNLGIMQVRMMCESSEEFRNSLWIFPGKIQL